MAEWRLAEFVEERELGRGAQGRVVLARHAAAGTPVAIKYLARGDAAAVAGLRAEARMLGRLTSPYVARLYRFVEGQDGAAIVMEAVDGVSLKAVLAEHGALAPEAALLVLKGSLLGLAAAHSVGVVHRDYKPANVVVRADGLSKLVDFGVAVLAGEGSFAGTPAYMAPEQWRGEPATPATDVYAATCVFVECVTGRRPYAEESRETLRERHLTAPADVADVPAALRPLVAAGMAKNPVERPPGAAAFVTRLEDAAVAAYGNDWEQRGVRALAGAAVALAALFPLAALTVTPGAAGAAAGAGGAGAAGTGLGAGGAASGASGMGGAGTAGAGAGKGFLATAAGKGALAVAGAAVVAASATAAVYATRGGGHKAPRPRAAAVNVASETRVLGGVSVENAAYVTVTGLGDPALEKRINQELRAPLDRLITIGTASSGRNPCNGRPTRVATTARAGLRGPRLVSVRYFMQSDWCRTADGAPGGEVVTVDLRTGRRLTAEDVFRPEALTPEGVARLQGRVTQRPFKGSRTWSDCAPQDGRFKRADLFPVKANSGAVLKGMEVDPPRLSAFFTPSEFRLAWLHAGSDGCGDLDFGAPYASVREFLKPDIAALLPA